MCILLDASMSHFTFLNLWGMSGERDRVKKYFPSEKRKRVYMETEIKTLV